MDAPYCRNRSVGAEECRTYSGPVGRDFTALGHALSAAARSTILNLLMDGSSRPASELAAAARISASTASEHLGVLVEAGLVAATPRGRQRFYRVKDPAVAQVLEHLGTLCPETPVVSFRQSSEARRLSHARLCYDHLAGSLGVALTDSMAAMLWLSSTDGGLQTTEVGLDALASLGILPPDGTAGRRPLCRSCPDWTERRPHLAGRLGALLAGHALRKAWVRPAARGRGLTITEDGAAAFKQHWGVVLPNGSA